MTTPAQRVDRRVFLELALASLLPAGVSLVPLRSAAQQGKPATPPVRPPVRIPPTGRSPGIDTVVLIIKENRTYDALFGTFPGGDGENVGEGICLDQYDDFIPHSRAIALQAKHTHVQCRQHPDNVPHYHALARAFTLCDAFFSEVRGPSFPNHQVLVAGQFTSLDDPGRPESWRCPDQCFDLPTFPEALDRAGKTWKAYSSGFIPAFRMFRRLRQRKEIVHWDQLAKDARAGALPSISWVYCERQESEHPPYSLCQGEEWTASQLRALMRSPQWPRMAIFVTWDDWGGIYDHVDPPVVEREPGGRPIRFGHRVPCLVISPWARRGHIAHARKSFLSLIRFSFETLRIPLPKGRVQTASSMSDCFDFKQKPNPPLALRSRPCPKAKR